MRKWEFSGINTTRLRCLEKRRSVSIPLEGPLDNDVVPNHSSGRDTPFRLPALDDVSRSGKSPKVSPHAHPHDESPLNTGMNAKHSKNNGSDELAVISDKNTATNHTTKRVFFGKAYAVSITSPGTPCELRLLLLLAMYVHLTFTMFISY